MDLAGGRDYDGVLGVLHAVGVAPGLVPPSAWIPTILGDSSSLNAEDVQELLGLVMRLYNTTLNNLSRGTTVTPPEDDLERCISFASGYVAGAALDRNWVEDDSRWTFVASFLYLTGERDIDAPNLSRKLEAVPDAERFICEQMHELIIGAYKSFAEARRALAGAPQRTHRSPPRAGRNDPCPCGSGKKYKRCCMLAVN